MSNADARDQDTDQDTHCPDALFPDTTGLGGLSYALPGPSSATAAPTEARLGRPCKIGRPRRWQDNAERQRQYRRRKKSN